MSLNIFISVFGVTAKVYGIVAGIPVPYSLPKANGCKDCNLSCPLSSGDHKYVNIFPVLKTYPDVSLILYVDFLWSFVYLSVGQDSYLGKYSTCIQRFVRAHDPFRKWLSINCECFIHKEFQEWFNTKGCVNTSYINLFSIDKRFFIFLHTVSFFFIQLKTLAWLSS